MPNRDRVVYWQGRLDKKTESARRAITDSNLKNVGTPEDVIVLREKLNDEGDAKETIISEFKVVNMLFPPLKDIPVKKVSNEFEDGYTITSLVAANGDAENQKTPTNSIQVVVPVGASINRGDHIVRVFVSNEQDMTSSSTVMIFKVTELTATMSNNAPLSMKATVVLSSEAFDAMDEETRPKFVKTVKLMAKRRLAAGY